MKKFKVGDKVKMLAGPGYYKAGDVGTVNFVDTDDTEMSYEVYFPEYGLTLWVYDCDVASFEYHKLSNIQFQSLTMEEVEQVFNSLPGGLEGFCKGWGWYDFARGIELLSKQKNGG